MNITNLWVIMPVYNEEEAVGGVIQEWETMLNSTGINYTFCCLNDGSKDQTQAVLEKYAQQNNRIKIIDKANSGHGQTCVLGYKIALENGADWVFQIDSDGQCDPVFFPQLVAEASASHKAVFGYRKKREDSFYRYLISRVVSVFSWIATGVWVKDANVPYRLMHKSILEKSLSLIPEDFHLANVYHSVLIRKQTPIQWVNIVFRERSGGSPSVKTYSFVKHGLKLFKQLKAASNARI